MKRALGLSVCGLTMLATIGQAQDTEFSDDLGAGDTAGPFSVADDDYGFFSHGYLRFGVGSTDGKEFTAFKLNGAASKYRLGNESDLYGEASLGYRADLGNGSDFVAEVMLNGGGDSNALNFGSDFNGWDDVAQAYVGIEYLGAAAFSDSFLWAGRRFYRRRDVHMTDFYYENLTGDGVGLENVSLGVANMSAALFYYDRDDDGLDYRSTTFDLRIHDVELGSGWLGEVGFAVIDGEGEDHGDDNGYSLRFHAENSDLGWGAWRNAFMYGRGGGIDFDSKGFVGADDDDSRFRFVTQALVISSDMLETQATAVWQRTDLDGDSETWFSAGVRPQYSFNDYFGVAVEAGYDRVSGENGDPASLGKLTIAPFYSFGRTGYFERPQLRGFVTWADWSDKGSIENQEAFGNATHGTTYGVQLEHWW